MYFKAMMCYGDSENGYIRFCLLLGASLLFPSKAVFPFRMEHKEQSSLTAFWDPANWFSSLFLLLSKLACFQGCSHSRGEKK